MDADEHALIHLGTMTQEKLAALLQVEKCISERLAGDVRYHYAVVALGDLAADSRSVFIEDVIEQAGSRCCGQVFRTKSNEPTCGNSILKTNSSPAIGRHVQQLTFAVGQASHDAALEFFRKIDRHQLPRLMNFSVHVMFYDCGARHSQLKALAAHGLDQHRQMQFTATGDAKFVRIAGFLDA